MMASSGASIADNWNILSDRVAKACQRAHRELSDVRIVGVSKRKSATDIKEALDAGCLIFGENYIQEAEAKIPEVLDTLCSSSLDPDALGSSVCSAVNLPVNLSGSKPEFHFIGHLQRNKIKRAVRLFDMFQSVDSLKSGITLAVEYEKYRSEIASSNSDINKFIPVELKRPGLPILIQVNVSREAQKGGILPDTVAELYASLLEYPLLDIQGLMTIGSVEADSAKRAKEFSSLYKLKESIEREFKKNLHCLSMGMSEDFEIAIAEGSSMIRIGSSLFGER